MDFGTEPFQPGQLIDGHQVAGIPSVEHPIGGQRSLVQATGNYGAPEKKLSHEMYP